MEYTFTIIQEVELSLSIEADSYEEALEQVDLNEFEQVDQPHISNAYCIDDDGEEYDFEPEEE